MAIYFPPNQVDGAKHTPDNGIEYTYNSDDGSWTAAVGGGGGEFVPLGSWATINNLP